MIDIEVGTYHDEESEYTIQCASCSRQLAQGACVVVTIIDEQKLLLFKDYECRCGTNRGLAVFQSPQEAGEDMQNLCDSLLAGEKISNLPLRPIEKALPGWDVPEGTHLVH